MVNTRRGEDGFRGEYPTPDIDVWEQFYVERGLVPPWKMVWADGKQVTPELGSKISDSTDTDPDT